MKRKMDFVLKNDEGFYKDIFRFYPRSTYVHSFNDNPPKNWNEVYKVYYSWVILRQYDDGCYIKTEKLFNLSYDECSAVPNLSKIIKYVIKTKEDFVVRGTGQPSGNWYIYYKTYYSLDGDTDYLEFHVFNSFTNQGYKFILTIDECNKFCEYLDRINDYALKFRGKGI